jgi:hypothetical protein
MLDKYRKRGIIKLSNEREDKIMKGINLRKKELEKIIEVYTALLSAGTLDDAVINLDIEEYDFNVESVDFDLFIKNEFIETIFTKEREA